MTTGDGFDATRPEMASEAALVTRVLVLWENGSATYFLRPGEQVKLGRHRECEIVIDLPSVSRRHARLEGASPNDHRELATIEDIGGMNGVHVGGHRIPTNEPVSVGAGDVIELGGAIVVLHPPQSSGAPSAGAMVRAAAHWPMSDGPMNAVERLIEVVAESDLGVLLVGETGVGKTFAAEAIHKRSSRACGPLLRLDCAALPEALLEGELFGYERGAFAGAVQAKAGLLETAAGGTVLLDGIGEMPLATQAKLLTVIETREVLRIGSVSPRVPRALDVRFIAATNHDLLARSAEGAFRLDLYYRVNGISVVIPPLRERAGEIPRFARKFLAEAAARGGRPKPRLSNEALSMLVHHPFFGNIRELRSTMERACVLATGGFIGPEHLLLEIPPGAAVAAAALSAAAAPPSVAAGAGATPSVLLPATRRFRPIAPTEPPAASSEPPTPIIIPAPPAAPRAPIGLPGPRKR